MFSIHSRARRLIPAAVFGAFATTGLHAGARFSGSTGYQIVKDGTAVSLEADFIDYRNMPKPRQLGPLKMFKLDGPWKWQTSYEGGTIDMAVAKISHHRAGRTGSLRLSVWATKDPYNGGMLRGYELGTVEKKALDPGYSYTDVQNVAKFSPPPDGNYHVCLVLSEFGTVRIRR